MHRERINRTSHKTRAIRSLCLFLVVAAISGAFMTAAVKAQSGLVSDYKSISLDMFPGGHQDHIINVINTLDTEATITAEASESVAGFVSFYSESIMLGPYMTGEIKATISIPPEATPSLYFGDIKVSSAGKQDNIPVTIRVLESDEGQLDIKLEPVDDLITPGEPVRVGVNIYNLGEVRADIQLVMQLINFDSGSVIAETEEFLSIETSTITVKKINTYPDMPVGNYIIRATAYRASQQGNNMITFSVAHVSVQHPWYTSDLFGFIPVWLILIVIVAVAGGALVLRYYTILKMKKRRYREKIDFRALPQPGKRSAFIGKVAETAIRTFFPVDRLQTHMIVAGATGSGKTVAAQGIVEEVLMKGGSVIVFDPTAQWTGFMRKCEDKRMLSRYGQFDMKVKDTRPFRGGIRIVEDPHELIDIEKHIKPGEITVFAINKLSTKDIDVFVVNTVEQVFRANLKESQKIKLLMVYDEVHRLLPKFGGSGRGFLQIERGCREFRKWGVGVMLVSQVLSDFVGEIKANIGTEMQMRTWYEGDLERIKMKYGEHISRSVAKSGIGTGMVVNSEYNKGRPYFVAFRPLLHNTRRLPEKELENYSKYNKMIDQMQYQLDQLRESGADVFDIEIELKLAKEKVCEGAFNMVDIYLESIHPIIESEWDKIGKRPAASKKELVSEDVLEKGVEEARKAREKYMEKEKKTRPANPTKGVSSTEANALKDRFAELEKNMGKLKARGVDTTELDKEIMAIKPDISILDMIRDRKKSSELTVTVNKLIKKSEKLIS